MPVHVRNGGQTRGRIEVKQEQDPTRSRYVLVARFHATAGHRTISNLYDAALVAALGDVWVLAGIERVVGGPMSLEHSLGQSWIITPAPIEDLIRAEAEINRLSGVLAGMQPGDVPAA